MIIDTTNLDQLAWKKCKGLLPVIVQHAYSAQNLMHAYMNRPALKQTLDTGLVTFFSRKRQQLWTKGITSGHTLKLIEICADCDQDALLVLVDPSGPACHSGDPSCWHNSDLPGLCFLEKLENTILSHKKMNPENSYTAKLFAAGIPHIARKLGEESIETVVATLMDNPTALKNEAADLLFHLLVLLHANDLSLAQLITTLKARHNQPNLDN